MSKPIVILGTGGHARVVADVCRAANRSIAGFVDSSRSKGEPVGFGTVLGPDSLLADRAFARAHEFLIGIADVNARRRLARRIVDCGGELTTVIHPRAVVGTDVEIGAGTVLVACSVVNTGARIGEGVIINTAATVDHDVIIGDFVHVAPGAHLAGSVRCRDSAFVGLGALVIQGITLGAGCTVGAGAVVVTNVGEGETVVGCPARAIRKQATS